MVFHAATVQAVVVAIWDSAGLVQYETELKARRLAAGVPGTRASTVSAAVPGV